MQPADVSWNAPFMSRYREHYDHRTAEEERLVTAAGNHRAPSKALMVQWVVEAWKAISTEVIITHIQKFQYIERGHLGILSRKYFPITSVDREKSEDHNVMAFALKEKVLKNVK